MLAHTCTHARTRARTLTNLSHAYAVFPCPQPVLDAAARLQLGPPRFKVTFLDSPISHGPIGNGGSSDAPAAASGMGALDEEERLQLEAVMAAAAFRAVSMEASGMPLADQVISQRDDTSVGLQSYCAVNFLTPCTCRWGRRVGGGGERSFMLFVTQKTS